MYPPSPKRYGGQVNLAKNQEKFASRAESGFISPVDNFQR
jgi:hypothetical protein